MSTLEVPAGAPSKANAERGARTPRPSTSRESMSGGLAAKEAVKEVHEPSFCVISGGTGCNELVEVFLDLGSSTTFVLPISDNGGSSSEIIRVCGGPSIGDLRSRLVRLIPRASASSIAIRNLFEYRLSPVGDSGIIKAEWLSIVEGRHRLWRGIPADRRECIRAFLVHFEYAVLKRAHRRFDFRNASVGNCFLAAAIMFLRSLQSAIFLFTSITAIPETAAVVPVINTSSVATIAAELDDRSVLVGQCEISHPATKARSDTPIDPQFQSGFATPSLFLNPTAFVLGDDDDALSRGDAMGDETDDDEEELREAVPVEGGNLVFSKDDEAGDADLPSPIRRIYYINQYGQEIFPRPNSAYLSSLATSSTLVYCCGSLYTSVIPCLALRGVGRAIATSSTLRTKALLLNSSLDRETRPACRTAVHFVLAIADALNRSEPAASPGGQFDVRSPRDPVFEPKDFVTHVVYMSEGEVAVDEAALEALGITTVKIPAALKRGKPVFDESNVRVALARIESEKR